MKQTALFDSDGYPAEETLQRIENWQFSDKQTFLELVSYAKSAYNTNYGNWIVIENYDKLKDFFFDSFSALVIATGGWSGNESVIDALKANRFFWALSNVASFRGGLYIFTTDILKK